MESSAALGLVFSFVVSSFVELSLFCVLDVSVGARMLEASVASVEDFCVFDNTTESKWVEST